MADIDRELQTRTERLTAVAYALDVSAVLAAVAGKAPAEVREVAEFSVEAVDIHRYGNVDDYVRITRVKVAVTRYRHDDREDDGAGYVRVEGFGRPLTRAGTPDQRKEPYWYPLPEELAAPLLLQAHTHSRNVQSEDGRGHA